MKPIPSHLNRRVADKPNFPVVDCNYSAVRLSEFNGRCAKVQRHSFRNITRAYFAEEARYNFVLEAIGLGLMTLVVVPAVVDCARAIGQFLRAVGLA